MLDKTIEVMRKDFKNSPDIIFRKVKIKKTEILLVYNVTLTNSSNINEFILEKLTTLDKTRNDPLAKAFRQLVKKERFNKKIEVVYVDTPAIKTGIIKEGNTNKEKYPLGSTIFVVGSVGLYIASIVFERLTGKE